MQILYKLICVHNAFTLRKKNAQASKPFVHSLHHLTAYATLGHAAISILNHLADVMATTWHKSVKSPSVVMGCVCECARMLFVVQIFSFVALVGEKD